MYNGTIINSSPTATFETSASLTGGAFTAVTLSENGVATSAVGDAPIGILISENELPIAQGDEVDVQINGCGLWIVGADVKAGDFLTSGENGVAVKATSGKFVLAQALRPAKAGTAAQVQIIKSYAG